MVALTWDESGKRLFETGVEKGVLYLPDGTGAYNTGFAWNGLVSVTETPSGADSNKQYADNGVYLNLVSAEEFGGTIEAFTYPEKFGECDGTVAPKKGVVLGQQPRKPFGLSYKTRIGSDLAQVAGYKLHLVYGALATPSEKAYTTVNDSPEAITFSWDFSTTPLQVTGHASTSLIVIDSTKVQAADLADLEDLLYGATTAPELPLPDDVIAMFTDAP
jgi:hypothetical protein